MTTFLKNFAAWQQSVRRQAELIRQKGPITSDLDGLVEAVFMAASIMRRAFRDAKLHTSGSSSSDSQITKIANSLLVTSEDHINIGAPLEAFGASREVESVTLQTLCADIVDGADLAISTAPLGVAYGFLVTPARFPHEVYYVHWKEFETALAGFSLLDPHAEPGTGIVAPADEILPSDAEGPTQPFIPKEEELLRNKTAKMSDQENTPEEGHYENEIDYLYEVSAEDGGGVESSSAEVPAEKDLGNKSDRFIPKWLGEDFLGAMASQAGEVKLPRELRAIWYALSSGEAIDLRGRLLEATLIDVEPSDIQDAEYLISRHTRQEYAMLFTCLYLCSLLIDEFPPVKGLIEHLRKAGTYSLDWKIRPDQLPGAIGEFELLISILVESLESGMWRGNPMLRKSFRPFYSLSFASLVQEEIFSVDLKAQEEIRNRLIEVFDYCRGEVGASTKRFPDSAYLRVPGIRKRVILEQAAESIAKRPSAVKSPKSKEQESVPSPAPKKDFSEPSRYVPKWAGSSFLKMLRSDSIPKVLPREIHQIFMCLRDAASVPEVSKIRGYDFDSLEVDQLSAVGQLLHGSCHKDNDLVFSTLYLTSLLMEKYKISAAEILALYKSGNVALRFVDRSNLWWARKDMEALISLVTVSFDLGMWSKGQSEDVLLQNRGLPFPLSARISQMQADPTGRAAVVLMLEAARHRLTLHPKRKRFDMSWRKPADQTSNALNAEIGDTEVQNRLNEIPETPKSKRSLGQKLLYVMTGYKEN